LVDHLKALGMLYVRPFKAVSLILDQGRLGWALAMALVAAFVVIQAELPDIDLPPGVPGLSYTAMLRLTAGPIFTVLAFLAVVFVPAAVVAVNQLEGTGSPGVVLPRDYMPMLVCHLMAFTAVTPLMVAAAWLPWPMEARLLSLPYLGFLSVCIVRTISGAGFGRAIATVLIAFGATIAASYLYSLVSGTLYFLASPFALYFLYIMFGQGIGSELRGIGGGLSSRQRMRQLLETSTVNPSDADARYQLGLIYQQRRDYEQAKKCFEEAIAIDKQEAEPHYQLGRVLRAQGHFAEALEHLKTAAAIDNKLSQSEVLRENGATLLDLGRDTEARDILREYTARRNFDPEGCY
jgi:hypothetical protein